MEIVQDRQLPLLYWLVKIYFVFPVVLYIANAIFNFYVYSDGLNSYEKLNCTACHTMLVSPLRRRYNTVQSIVIRS